MLFRARGGKKKRSKRRPKGRFLVLVLLRLLCASTGDFDVPHDARGVPYSPSPSAHNSIPHQLGELGYEQGQTSQPGTRPDSAGRCILWRSSFCQVVVLRLCTAGLGVWTLDFERSRFRCLMASRAGRVQTVYAGTWDALRSFIRLPPG
ncbi:hypothetical protein BS50DRAFT_271035 [Corynespora cassiicola Philippines]|uniref:Secreted protein n=1 Tax=Corynespora cassiicola Philippines TaxID=1448308 RepID=A0A2T2P042_CORCC|nr:hypothetical protein BS50DRAFT_271035 [Corynespora cassiicola Philippines]